FHVTGVQTCALPISVWLHGRIFRARETGARRAVVSVRSVRVRTLSDQGDGRYSGRRAEKLPGLDRADTIIIPGWRRRRPAPTRTSEERRVGSACVEP